MSAPGNVLHFGLIYAPRWPLRCLGMANLVMFFLLHMVHGILFFGIRCVSTVSFWTLMIVMCVRCCCYSGGDHPAIDGCIASRTVCCLFFGL